MTKWKTATLINTVSGGRIHEQRPTSSTSPFSLAEPMTLPCSFAQQTMVQLLTTYSPTSSQLTSSCWWSGAEAFFRRATPNQGSLLLLCTPGTSQATLPLRPQPNSPVWWGVQQRQLFLQAGMPVLPASFTKREDHLNSSAAFIQSILPPHPHQRSLR